MSATSEMQATVQGITRRFRRSPDVREALAAVWYRLAGTADRKRKALKWLKVGGPVAAVALGVGLWLILRPVPQPDYATANLKKVFNYTLLTDEFNKLSVEKRLELIGQLVNRLRNMSSGDSTMMAAFAVGIAGAARKQIEENASRLAIDMWDRNALLYKDLRPEDRGAFLDNAAIDFVRTMEAIGGEPSKKSDTDLLADMHKQAQRDQENLKDPNRAPPSRAMGRLFTFMRGNVGSHATPAQRSRGQLMMRDMVRRMRGQDLDTGKGGGG
jgi:hypothetical protein